MRLLGSCVLSLAIVGLASCADEPEPGRGPLRPVGPDGRPIAGEPDPIGALIAEALAGIAQVDPEVVTLAHRVREPLYAYLEAEVGVASCQEVENQLWLVCNQVTPSSCWVNTTFYWAHDIPRCSARIEIEDDYMDEAFSRVYALDFAGASRLNPAPDCGDGVIGSGEDCDDGNLEPWDGCDPDCKAEPFEGCETVIQQEFSAASIAWIDATAWRSPRSHLMVHDDAAPFDGSVDGTLCDRARTTAETACGRLATDMPFVSWCSAEVHLTDSTRCDVRMRVQFLTRSPDDGVFTTSLQGVLAFTVAD